MITRAQIRRQLRKDGGIMSITPREKYGLGSSLKKFVRKIIPNEIAQVASAAAPFVAPFNPMAAGLMAGVGGFDQHGSLSRGLRSGVLTYGGGQAARYLGGANLQRGYSPMGGMTNMKYGLSSPIGTQRTGLGTMIEKFRGAPTVNKAADYGNMIGKGPLHGVAPAANVSSKQNLLHKILLGNTDKGGFFKGKGLFGAEGAFNLQDAIGKGMPGIFLGTTTLALLGDKLAGPKGDDESLDEYMTRRKSSVSNYLRQYYKNVRPTASAADVEEFVQRNTSEYKAQGGRIGYANGTPKIPEQFLEDFKRRKYEDMIEEYRRRQEDYERRIKMAPKQEAAQGGRINKLGGGVMGLPVRQNSAGVRELDLRDSGGFVPPVGVKEKADDIPAMLSNNEFVFTADAVKAAGGGSVEKGAQRMYDTMKKLESRIA